MTRRLDFFARNGNPAVGELALPAAPQAGAGGRAPAVIVIHEWWGLNDDVRRLASRFAREGFLALAVDLYEGRSTTDPAAARALAQALDTACAVEVIGGAIDRLVAHPRAAGPVAVVGFCLGGAMALAAAVHLPELAAAVPFYGIPGPKHADWSRVRATVLAHFGEADPLYPPERVQALENAMRAAGVELTLHRYAAGHAFMREGSEAFDEDAAALAWQRTVAFLRRRLGEGGGHPGGGGDDDPIAEIEPLELDLG